MRAFVSAMAAVCLLTSCATSVNRVDPRTVTDVSGYWNDTDSRLVAEEMITDCITKPWIGNFQAAHAGAAPTVIIGGISLHAQEHIDTLTFTKALERELLNSGKVKFVASDQERQQVRAEREDQQENASAASMKQMRHETGADFQLGGDIEEIVDRKDGTAAKTYQVNLELIDLESNNKIWIDTKEIKKMIHRGGVGL